MVPFPHPINKKIVKSSRIVTLPHWQGLGIGMRMSNFVCELPKYADKCIHATTTLPIRQSYLTKSDKWVLKAQGNWDAPTSGEIGIRSGIYMETHKFINNTLCEKDIKPHYSAIKKMTKPKKNNDHKMDIILARIAHNKIVAAEEEKRGSYYENVLESL